MQRSKKRKLARQAANANRLYDMGKQKAAKVIAARWRRIVDVDKRMRRHSGSIRFLGPFYQQVKDWIES
jgi:hypothetical protein